MVRIFGTVHGGLLLCLVFAAPSAAAQVAPVVRTSCASALTPTAACFRQLESRRHEGGGNARAPDHRYEGMAIGGGIGLVGGALLGLGFCGLSEANTSSTQCAIVGGLGMGILAGFVGMMIGAQFPKEEAGTNEQPAPSDSVSQ